MDRYRYAFLDKTLARAKEKDCRTLPMFPNPIHATCCSAILYEVYWVSNQRYVGNDLYRRGDQLPTADNGIECSGSTIYFGIIKGRGYTVENWNNCPEVQYIASYSTPSIPFITPLPGW